jgi:hypothetical protein
MSVRVQRSGSWGPCPESSLVELADRQRSAHRHQQLVHTACTVAALLLLFSAGLAAGIYWLPRLGPPGEAETTCQEIQYHFGAFHRHLSDQEPVEAALAEQVSNHFHECNSCAAIYKRKYPGELKKYFDGLSGGPVAYADSPAAVTL